MAKYKDFKEYMQANYSEVIINKLKPVIYEDKDSFESEYFLTITIAKPTNITVDGVTFKDLGDDWLEIRTSVYAEIEITGKTRNDYESDLVSKPYNVFFKAKLQDGLKDASVTKVEEYSKPIFDKDKSLSQNLLHYFYEEDIEKHAEDFLLNHFPRALNEPMPLPVEEIAKNMGMEIYYAPLGESIFGKTYFGTETVTVYTDMFGTDTKEISTRPGTMLINLDVYFMYNIGTVNNTIIHECVHWDKHRKAFELQKLLDTGNKSITCEVVETTYKGIPNDAPALKWMEWQANALAPRIQMPTKTAKPKFKQILARLYKENPDERKAVIMQMAVEEIADFYQVSKTLAKIRVMDMGFPAEGTFVYMEGCYFPPYIYDPKALNKDESFVLDEKNRIYLCYFNEKVADHIRSGRFIYANFAVCINDPKYIDYSEVGVPFLTDYALEHMDEGCLKFKRKNRVSKEYDDSYYKQCFLCKNVDAEDFVEADFNSEDEDNQDVAERAEEMRKIGAAAKDLADQFDKMPGSFGKTLLFHMERKDITVEELEGASGVSVRSIGTYRNDPTAKPDFYTVIALCIGMKLHPSYTVDMIKKAGYDLFQPYTEEKAYFQDLIFNHHMEDLDSWNRKLAQWGLKTRIPSVKAAEKRGTEDDYELE
ncbi:MAG: hypothetical protein IKZ94_08850 [Lachnospiraceae bacterium]|nr:hypothetical protein [Lachnospiraceae bacterium]